MRTALLGAATVAALAAGTLATTGVLGSSHREAPRIMLDPSADNTDLYAFTAPDAPGKLTVVSNWVPLQNPAGGPYFGKLDPAAHYYVKIDNTGDGVEDVAYRWQFKNKFRNPNSFLYAVPPVNSIGDPNLNFVQTYDLYYERYRNGQAASARGGSPRTSRSRPTTSARRRCPNYAAVAAGANATCRAAARRSSARPTTRSSSTSARSSTASTSTSPAARRSGSATRAAARTTCRASTSTRSSCRCRSPSVTRDGRDVSEREGAERRRRRLDDDRAQGDQGRRRGRAEERWVQVSRLGNPLINEVIIPIGAQGQVQRDVARGRPEELRRRRAQPRSRRGSSTRCSTSASRRPTARTSSRRC